MMKKLALNNVQYVPKLLEAGILYVSEEFGIAAHMCPCGCGNKIITPLGTTDWSLTVKDGKPSLYPSIGNWQIPCRSHYWITKGSVIWSHHWTEKQIAAGRQIEEKRRKTYFDNLERKGKKQSIFRRVLNWILQRD